MQLLGDVFKREQPSRVNRRHVAQPDNHNRRQRVHVFGHGPNFVRRAEQERAVDSEDKS